MYPMIVVCNTQDIYIQCILFLHTPGDLALCREYMFEKLLPTLALHLLG
jgi:hypothetical protein